MTVLAHVGFLLWWVWAGWGMYVLIMGIYRVYLSKKMTPLLIFLSFPYLVVGTLMDVLSNIVLATLIFADIPREWLITTRLIRYKNQKEDTWRKRLAILICFYLLDIFDPTENHCDTKKGA